MTEGVITKLLHLFEGDRAVRRVAEDPVLTAELLLLFRMILADGQASDSEMAAFRRICGEAFDISETSMEHVLEYLEDFGYETNVAQSLAMFRRLDHDRKQMLARHMVAIARADEQLRDEEVSLLKRTLRLLEISPQEAAAGGQV